MSLKTNMNKKLGAGKIATIIASVLWLLSIALAFMIPARSKGIWIPDALLLAGFFPLLFVYRPSWPWFVFGILNILIDYVLCLTAFAPDNAFPANVLSVKHHLQDYHDPFTWLCFGIISIVYGSIRLSKNIFVFITNKAKQNK